MNYKIPGLALILAVASCSPGGEPENAAPAAEDAVSSETDVVARVLGEDVRAEDAATMQEAILAPLFARYVQERGFEATDSEIQAVGCMPGIGSGGE